MYCEYYRSTLEDMKESLREITCRSILLNLIHSSRDAQIIKEHNGKLDDAIKLFSVSSFPRFE